MRNLFAELGEAVLTYAEDKPIEKRIRLMRILAEYAGDPDRTAEMKQRAAELETAHRRCRELRLNLKKPPARDGLGDRPKRGTR